MQRLLLRRAGRLALPGVLIFAVVFIGCSDAPPATPEASPPEAQAAGAEAADTDAAAATEDTEAGPPATPEAEPKQQEPDDAEPRADGSARPEAAHGSAPGVEPDDAEAESARAAADAASRGGRRRRGDLRRGRTPSGSDVFDGLERRRAGLRPRRTRRWSVPWSRRWRRRSCRSDVSEPWEVSIFSCLDSGDRPRPLRLAIMIAEIETDEGAGHAERRGGVVLARLGRAGSTSPH